MQNQTTFDSFKFTPASEIEAFARKQNSEILGCFISNEITKAARQGMKDCSCYIPTKYNTDDIMMVSLFGSLTNSGYGVKVKSLDTIINLERVSYSVIINW